MFWPINSLPATSATASACSPVYTGTLLRTNSTALSLSGSYARKYRTIPGFPSESKAVTRTFQPAAIAALCAATATGQQPQPEGQRGHLPRGGPFGNRNLRWFASATCWSPPTGALWRRAESDLGAAAAGHSLDVGGK